MFPVALRACKHLRTDAVWRTDGAPGARAVHCPNVTQRQLRGIWLSLSIPLACLSVTSLCSQQECPTGPANIAVADGTYAPAPGIEFHLKRFRATLLPLGTTSPLCFQKLTIVSRAEIFISNESLTKVFTAKLEKSDSNIRDLKVKHDPSGVTLSGVIPKLIPVHFSLHGPVTTDGMIISMHAMSMKAEGIPIKGLMDLIGKHITDVLKLQGMSGVQIRDNELSFSPEKVAHLRGHIARVLPSDAGLTLVYDSPQHPRRPVRKP